MSLAHTQIEGKYEILQKLNEGGMGAIYKVRHRLLDVVRVIKVMRPQLSENPDLKERFLNEARTTIRLRHPNIATVHDLSVDRDGIAYIVMEFIEGRTLAELLAASGPLRARLTTEVALQTLRALSYLHGKSFVHRDISPDNIMLTRDVDKRPLVKLIDLGIAKMLESESVTAEGMFLGKLRYCSPEHFADGRTEHRIEPRSDLYSLGVVLYELLTGCCPIVGSSSSALVAGHLYRAPRSFAETDPQGQVPEELRRVVLQALEKRPEHRPGSSKAMAAALRRVMRGSSSDLTRDVETTLCAPAADEETLRLTASRSDQRRLDAQFAAHPTPPPVADGAAPQPTGAGSEGGEKPPPGTAIADQVSAIARQISHGELEEAEAALDRAIAAFGRVRRLERLRDRLQEVRASTERRALELDEAVERIEAHLEGEELEAADSELFRAEKLYREPSRLEPLRQRLRKLLDERRERRGAELMERAERHLAEGELEDAARLLQKLLIVGTGRKGAQELLRQVDERLQLREIEILIEGGDLVGAGAALVRAERQERSAPALHALRRRIEERQATRAEAEEHMRTGRYLVDLGRYRGALNEMREVLALEPGHQQAASLLARAESAIARLEDEEVLARRVASEVRRTERLIRKGEVDLAGERLEVAVEELGRSIELEYLQTRIPGQETQASDLVAEADRLAKGGKRSLAGRKLRRALRLHVGNQRAADLLVSLGLPLPLALRLRPAMRGVKTTLGRLRLRARRLMRRLDSGPGAALRTGIASTAERLRIGAGSRARPDATTVSGPAGAPAAAPDPEKAGDDVESEQPGEEAEPGDGGRGEGIASTE